MKLFIVLCFVALVGLSVAADLHPRGCIYAYGQCVDECEEGTHEYLTKGCGYYLPEATCEKPDPKMDYSLRHLCDFSSCYCDPPTVRNRATDKCVNLDDCPTKKE